MGIGDWGLGIGDWGLGQSPIPNPQSPLGCKVSFIKYKNFIFIYFKIIL
jgi:hypothetical protein